MSEGSLLRRDVLALVGGLAAVACGGPRVAAPSRPVRDDIDALKVNTIVDLVPAAGLIWLVAARPREMLASPVLGPAVATVISGPHFERFARRHGGIDIRAAEQIFIAAYPEGTLLGARIPIDPTRVESAFAARVTSVDGRAADRGVTRLWGRAAGSTEQVALLGRDAVIFERGKADRLRGAVYFAEGRLRRSLPALQAEPLNYAASCVGESPLRAFAPGPFEGQWAGGIAGLLRATTALAVALRPSPGPNAAVSLRLVLVGGWGEAAAAAAMRLRAVFDLLAEDPLGRLTGMNHPIASPSVSADAGALQLDIELDAAAFALGLHAATDASLTEIMSY